MKHPEGIEGLQGREPVGAAVTIGIKSGRGFPVLKDRFHIVSPRDVDGIRPHLQHFAFFNEAEVKLRTVLKGNLLHSTQAECFEHRLTLQSFPKGYAAPRSHPNMRPVCEGDGKDAVRWMKDDEGEQFSRIRCPNRLCEFRQADPPSCKPFMRLLFRLRWNNPDLPTPLVKFNSRAWSTVANCLGMFDRISGAAKQVATRAGFEPEYLSLWGLPFSMLLTEQTNAKKKARFPVVVFDVSDPEAFFIQQVKDMSALRELPKPPEVARLTDDSEQSVDVVYDEIQHITVGDD